MSAAAAAPPAPPTLPAAAQAKFDPYLLGALLNQFAHYNDRADGGAAPLVSVGFTIELPAASPAPTSAPVAKTANKGRAPIPAPRRKPSRCP